MEAVTLHVDALPEFDAVRCDVAPGADGAVVMSYDGRLPDPPKVRVIVLDGARPSAADIAAILAKHGRRAAPEDVEVIEEPEARERGLLQTVGRGGFADAARMSTATNGNWSVEKWERKGRKEAQWKHEVPRHKLRR